MREDLEFRGKDISTGKWVYGNYCRLADGNFILPTSDSGYIDEPYYNSVALGCGLEDNNISDRYEAMRYGWDQATEKVSELLPNFIEVKGETVGVMLKNINGKKYFEGDIGITKDGENLTVILVWIDEFSMCSWLSADEYRELQNGKLDFDKTMFWTYSFEDKYADQIELVGNIYDSPDLIK